MESVVTKKREVFAAVRLGARGRCPSCGKGRLFSGFLKVAPACDRCGEHLHHHRADDAPAYLTILIVGHLMLPLVLGVEEMFEPAIWVHLLLWGTLIPAACLTLLPHLKGMIVGLQWATGMHGFGAGDTAADI